jgi:hypothetical protein
MLRELLRYALQAKYDGPSIQQIRDEMNKTESSPLQSKTSFADLTKRYSRGYKLQKKTNFY